MTRLLVLNFLLSLLTNITATYSDQNIKRIEDQIQKRSRPLFQYDSNKWIKAYALGLGTGISMNNAFIQGPSTSDKNVTVINHGDYRHPILDRWSFLPIEEVKLVLYKEQKPVVTMVFDGRNSTITNWFTADRLKSSPWKDLVASSKPKFLIDAVIWEFVVITDGVCDTITGWLMVVKMPSTCGWDEDSEYPHILYSDKQNKTHWSQGEPGHADGLSIFIRQGDN